MSSTNIIQHHGFMDFKHTKVNLLCQIANKTIVKYVTIFVMMVKINIKPVTPIVQNNSCWCLLFHPSD